MADLISAASAVVSVFVSVLAVVLLYLTLKETRAAVEKAADANAVADKAIETQKSLTKIQHRGILQLKESKFLFADGKVRGKYIVSNDGIGLIKKWNARFQFLFAKSGMAIGDAIESDPKFSSFIGGSLSAGARVPSREVEVAPCDYPSFEEFGDKFTIICIAAFEYEDIFDEKYSDSFMLIANLEKSSSDWVLSLVMSQDGLLEVGSNRMK
ncbi:hypothetical protein [uncultured Maricaulis sp.]|uniref:hypothetical protein n=1 Tax=uncultured Maricaulis sp. TaxID=174710 RepID=UPI00263A3CE3|nr:hypothetical protein [uncultured Maricaulis sp.]